MSDVWDRAVEVIGGRGAILAGIVLPFVWLPALLQSALRLALLGPAASSPSTPAGAAGAALLVAGLAVAALASLGQLAMVAVASDPAVGRREALALAVRRFWPYAGMVLIAIAAAAVLLVPIAAALATAYPSLAAMRAGGAPPVSTGVALFVALYGLAVLVLLAWAEARLLSVLAPVVVNERLGVGAFARSLALTRGLAWRIVGVMLLFAVVAGVAVIAVRSVVGVALRLLLGAERQGTALFVTGAAVSLLGCVIAVVVAAFVAQLYVAARERGAGAGVGAAAVDRPAR